MNFCLHDLFVHHFHYSYEITLSKKKFIQVFIDNCPESFQNITEGVSKITKDKEINIYDIPEIIYCIAKIYHVKFISLELENIDNLLFFIKCTVYILIESGFLILPPIENKIIEKIIDSSIDLLGYNLSNKNSVEEIKTICYPYCCIV